jgi:hypothetical protein
VKPGVQPRSMEFSGGVRCDEGRLPMAVTALNRRMTAIAVHEQAGLRQMLSAWRRDADRVEASGHVSLWHAQRTHGRPGLCCEGPGVRRYGPHACFGDSRRISTR